MVGMDAPAARGPGRPPTRSEAATRALIIDAAARAFLETGYARSGVGAIAREAGISTRTLYRLFATKEDLLRQAMERRIDEAFAGLDIAGANDSDGRASLDRLLVGYAALALSDEAMRLTRLIIAERNDVPSLVESYRQATARVTAIFDAWVGAQQRRGFLRSDASGHAAHLLRAMINEAQRQMLLGLRPPLTDDERAAWVAATASVFLDGCATGSAP